MTAKTRLVGVIGWPIEHSLSPEMHNAAFEALGLDWSYVPLSVEPERVGEAVAGLRALGFVGANVTVPHKGSVIPHLDELSPAADALGAVNVIVVREGRLLGDNTDGSGFLTSLAEAGFDPAGRRAVVLGAGGAGRAVTYALASVGAEVAVYNRTPDRAEALVEVVRAAWPQAYVEAHPLASLDRERDRGPDLIVNATSVGMWPAVDACPWPEEVPLPASATVYDVVCRPRKTRLLALARQSGCQTIDGLGMLVHQGAAAFRLWTGREPPIEVMRNAVQRSLVAHG